MKYEAIEQRCDLTTTSMGWAAQLIGPAFIYDLYVRADNIVWVRQMLHQFGADTRDNPLAPYVNLCIDNDLGPYEWYLSANGKASGSEGC